MLVLSRKKNEAIVFSTTQGDIVVEVVRVNGDKVRLGIELEDCDEEVSVHRKEVFDKIKQNKEITNKPRRIASERRPLNAKNELYDPLGDDEDGCGPDRNYVDTIQLEKIQRKTKRKTIFTKIINAMMKLYRRIVRN